MRQVAGLGMDYLAQQYQNTGNPLYQSAFAQLSAASNGNELADAMASVMGIQLARPPSSAPNTPPASVATSAKPSQNGGVDNVATSQTNPTRSGGTANSTTGAQLSNDLAIAQTHDPRIGTTLPGANAPITVTAEGSIGSNAFFDTNQKARPSTQANPNQPQSTHIDC